GFTRGREPAVAGLSVQPGRGAGIPMPVPMAQKFDCVLGQSRRAALCGRGLLSPNQNHAPDHHLRRRAVLTMDQRRVDQLSIPAGSTRRDARPKPAGKHRRPNRAKTLPKEAVWSTNESTSESKTEIAALLTHITSPPGRSGDYEGIL